ncbi:VOC family protein [Mucilaginibacter sp. P25]|uniref:VOC family protein n=1 Tax=Mucilaginibacter sp. P25 TaxID=3423945 RepID=UPI003D799008
MKNHILEEYKIDYVEIYTPLAKILAYWHCQALGFEYLAFSDSESGNLGNSSFVIKSNDITLVLTSSFPTRNNAGNGEVTSFINQNYCGVKRIALVAEDVPQVFSDCIGRGAIPIKMPQKREDEFGYVEDATIKLFDSCEIMFIDRSKYQGPFKPGFKLYNQPSTKNASLLKSIDHIASELRINESRSWSEHLSKILDINLAQAFETSEENKTGMTLRVNQSFDKNLTMVLAEPESYLKESRVQKNIDTYGPGVHHLAFSTDNIMEAINQLTSNGVEFVKFPPSYYELLRTKKEFEEINIDELENGGILIDKEEDTYLLQKFIKPISDRPFFFYEIVQRVNGYNGFAINNINILKKAEELEIMKTGNPKT